jgi:copper chaperone CopZ
MEMTQNDSRTVLLILGMRNNGCREAVTAALEAVHGVREVQVSLFRGLATVRHDNTCMHVDLVTAVVNAGFGAAPTGNDNGSQPRTGFV